MVPIEIPSRDVVEHLCKDCGFANNGFAYSDQVWIKCGGTVTLGEAAIQRYARQHADPRIVRIPEVYDAFRRPRANGLVMTYIVMENVKDDDYVNYRKKHPEEAERALEAIADAVRHIWDIPLPPNAPPGPFEQQIPTDRFFSDCSAGRSFDDLGELEDWVNNKLEEAGRPDRISLQGEQLCLCHGDLSQFNIKVGETITIIDWGFSGIYPRAFEEFALLDQCQKFAKALHKQLFGPKMSKYMRPLSLAARYHAFGR